MLLERLRARAAPVWALVFALNLVIFVPRMVFPNRSAGTVLWYPHRARVPGIAYELGLLLALLALGAGSRFQRAQRAMAVLLLAALLLFITYYEAYQHYFCIDPAVVDDVRLLVGLSHFLRDASIAWCLSVTGVVTAYVLAVALAARTCRRFQDWAREIPTRKRTIGALAFAVASSALVFGAKQAPENTLVQPISDDIFANVAASRQLLASERAIFDSTPDTRYDGFLSTSLSRRPNVYLLMFEAYGEILATCQSNTAYRELLARIGTQLAAAGFHARSGYSNAPIYGGRSWLSIGTVQTGIRMDVQSTYHVLERTAPRLPTLTTFFKAHGYYTIALQPWDKTRFGLPVDDIYQRDRLVVRKDLPYKGSLYGVAGVPDQFSLGYFSEHFLSSAPQPWFVFYMATSTHYNWSSEPPFVQDYKQLEPPGWDPSHVVPWAALPGIDAVTDTKFVHYLGDIVYEWRSLAAFIEKHRDEDALFLVLGDHQPFLHCGGTESFHTPLHVISRDPSLVDMFVDVGLEPGLYARPGAREPLRHEGIFSLLVSKLTDDPSRYFPAGIALSGLRR